MSVAIINYELGNLRSVQNAIEFIGKEAFIAQSPMDLQNASHIILPGVGAFGEGIDILNKQGWSDAIKEHALNKAKPFLGICLGMQLLAKAGTENGDHSGLGLIDGIVNKLETNDKSIHVPHIGWNHVTAKSGSKMYRESKGADYYFVHSYVLKPTNEDIISGTCHHGQDFVASIESENIWGAQFHPEKSQKAGLQLLTNFLKV